MTFQLDTTGSVGPVPGWIATCSRFVRWEDLDAFTQGYVEAAFGDWNRDVRIAIQAARYSRQRSGFRHLAPETLARIIADCKEFQSRPTRWVDTVASGRAWWADRQSGFWTLGNFPPLTVQLGDDGKVRFTDGEA